MWVREMKRIIPIFFIFFVFISACGRLVKTNKISSTDFFSGVSCDIPLENLYSAPPYVYLHTNESIEELKLKLDDTSNEMNNFSVVSLTNNSLLIDFSENEKGALFILKEFHMLYQESEYKYHYWFSDFSIHLRTSDETKESCGIAVMDGIPLPLHLLVNKNEEISENKEVPMTGNIDDFEKFYQRFQQVYPNYPIEIERLEDKLALKKVPIRYNYSFDKDGIRHYESKQVNQIIITFSENSNHEPILVISCKVD